MIDPAGNYVSNTIDLSGTPFAVAVSPTGPEAGDIYVTNFEGDNVSVFDPTTDKLVANIDVGYGPYAVAVAPSRPEAGDIYVASAVSNDVSVIDPAPTPW